MKTSCLRVLSPALLSCFVAGGPLIRGNSGSRSQAAGEIEAVPLSIGSFEVSWTLDSSGYGTHAHILLKGKYSVGPKRTGGIRDHKGFCKEFLSVTYAGGGLVEAEGANSTGERVVFRDAGPPAGSRGMVCRMRDGAIEIRLPEPDIEYVNAAAEEASGCFGWRPVMRMSPAAYRELASSKRTMKWGGPAATAEEREAASECRWSATIELDGKLPRVALGETCREWGGVVSAPPKGDVSKSCKGGEFDGFRVEEIPGHEPYEPD